jgi:toluene monooxygenase system protein A
MSGIPICGVPGDKWSLQDYPLEHEGRTYHFGSEIDRWIFQVDPARYRNHMSVVDRFLAGMIQPMNLQGALQYMSLGPGEAGDDAHAYAWVAEYAHRAAKLAAAA